LLLRCRGGKHAEMRQTLWQPQNAVAAIQQFVQQLIQKTQNSPAENVLFIVFAWKYFASAV